MKEKHWSRTLPHTVKDPGVWVRASECALEREREREREREKERDAHTPDPLYFFVFLSFPFIFDCASNLIRGRSSHMSKPPKSSLWFILFAPLPPPSHAPVLPPLLLLFLLSRSFSSSSFTLFHPVLLLVPLLPRPYCWVIMLTSKRNVHVTRINVQRK